MKITVTVTGRPVLVKKRLVTPVTSNNYTMDYQKLFKRIKAFGVLVDHGEFESYFLAESEKEALILVDGDIGNTIETFERKIGKVISEQDAEDFIEQNTSKEEDFS